MNALATVQGQLSSAQSLAWNPVPIPPSLLTSEISDVGICALIEDSNPHIQYASLRYAPREVASSATTVFVDQFLLSMKSVGGWPKEVKWTRHVAEGSKQYLGIISYSYTVDEDSSAPTRIAFYDAYVVIGSLAGQLIKQPQTHLPINCTNTHGFLGTMAVPADTEITSWQPDGRWSNTIAVGCADGTVYFGDLSALKPNDILMLDQDSSTAINVNQGPIRSLCWHHQAMSRDILLVGGASGFAIVHTRNLKILMAPSDTHKRKNVSGVCWLENGNSVAVTYNDETASVPTGVLQLWDLRRCTHPYKEIPAHHQSGVIGLMRSSIDSRFFCTVSTDGRVVTWATFGSNAVPYSEISVQQPCKTFGLLPCSGLMCVITQSQVYILNLDSHVVAENLKFSPQWLLSSNALAFGFGGKLAYLHNRVNPSNGQMETAAGICDLPCDDTFVEAVDVFVKYLGNNDLAGYCRMRSQEAENLGDPYEADIWSLLAAAFANPSDRIHLLLRILGYSANNIQSQAQAFLGHPAGEGVIKSAEIRNPNLQSAGGLGSSVNTIGQEDSPTEHEAASFFDKLACTTNNNESTGSLPNSNKITDTATGEMLTSKTGYIVDRDWSSGPLKLLKDLFLIGQPLGAIEFALQANDFGLAFMIACSLDNKMVLQTIKEKFIEFNKQSFVKVIAQSSEDDFEAIVNCCEDPSEEWKEIASILITYPMMQEVAMSGTTVEYHRLCCMLAQRLADDGDLMSAIPCFLVAGAFSQAAKLIANLPSTAGSQALKIIILRCLINQTNNVTEPDAQSAQVVQLFLTRLVNSGHIEQSTSLLNLIGHDFPGTSQLRSLIDETRGGPTTAAVYQPIYEVQVAPSFLAQTQQAQYQRAATQPVVPQQQPGMVPPGQRGMMPPNPMGMSMGGMPSGLNLGLNASLPPSSMQSVANPYGAPPSSMGGAPVMPPSIQQKPMMVPSTIPGMTQIPPQPQNMHQMQSPPAIPNFTAPPTSNPPATTNAFTPPRNTSTFAPNPQQAPFAPQAQNVFAPPSAQQRNNPQVPPPPPVSAAFPGAGQSQMYNQQSQHQIPSMPNIPHIPNMMTAPRMMSPSIPAIPEPPHMMPPSGAPSTTSAFQLASNATARPSAGSEEWQKSTHPAACVGGHIQPGMPTPWPLPTAAQQTRSAASEQFVQQVRDASRPQGVACTPADLNKIKSALDLAITRIPDASKQPMVRSAVQELYNQLNEMDLSASAIEQLSQFADALNSQNFMMARDLAQVMISTSWKKNSRNWLTALKKLANPGTYQAAQASF